MNVAEYFASVRAVARELPGGDVLVMSLTTKDGGRAGIVCEVPNETAAKMIVDGRARQASEEEIKEYRKQQEEGLRRAEEAQALTLRRHLLLRDDSWREHRETGKSK